MNVHKFNISVFCYFVIKMFVSLFFLLFVAFKIFVPGMEAFMSLKPQIIEGLKGVKDQPSESEKYGQLDKGPATFGVVKRLRDNDMELHTNQTVKSNKIN